LLDGKLPLYNFSVSFWIKIRLPLKLHWLGLPAANISWRLTSTFLSNLAKDKAVTSHYLLVSAAWRICMIRDVLGWKMFVTATPSVIRTLCIYRYFAVGKCEIFSVSIKLHTFHFASCIWFHTTRSVPDVSSRSGWKIYKCGSGQNVARFRFLARFAK